MAWIVRNNRVGVERWPQLDEAAVLAAAARPGDDCTGVLVPLPLWLARREACTGLGVDFGILLQATDDPSRIVPDLARIGLIAIAIARFSDGRAYSSARLLRDRYRYRGELRAVGDVLADQLHYLRRAGFDAFALRADQDPQTALAALHAFSTSYQAAADQPLPLFRRRHA